MGDRTVTIALDSFKGSIGAARLGDAVARRLAERFPGVQFDNFPCSDGGDGFAESVAWHIGGKWVECTVCDPLMRPRAARYLWSEDDRLAVIEAAEANGLVLLAPGERDPLAATSFGVGELLLDAARRGAESIIIGVGGSATVDGGVGMACAIGVRFLRRGRVIDSVHITDFAEADSLEVPSPHPLKDVQIVVASDVRTRLRGPRAASAIWIYGPQKGGTEASLAEIEECLSCFDRMVRARLGIAYGEVEMGGAAGGLAAGLAAFAGAKLRLGMELFDELTGLRAQIESSALVITGEGRLDAQSAEGKVVSYVSRAAREAGVPVVALCGSAQEHRINLDGVVQLVASGMSVEECIAHPLAALDGVLPRLESAVADPLDCCADG